MNVKLWRLWILLFFFNECHSFCFGWQFTLDKPDLQGLLLWTNGCRHGSALLSVPEVFCVWHMRQSQMYANRTWTSSPAFLGSPHCTASTCPGCLCTTPGLLFPRMSSPTVLLFLSTLWLQVAAMPRVHHYALWWGKVGEGERDIQEGLGYHSQK